MYENLTYPLTRLPYGRRGTPFYLASYLEDGQEVLYVCALLSGLDHSGPHGQPRLGRLFPVQIIRDEKPIAYTLRANPAYVEMAYEGGCARLTLQEGSILRMCATGAQVKLAPELSPHEIAKTRNDGSWELLLNPLPKLLFYPIQGTMEVKTGFDVIHSVSEDTSFTFTADGQGGIDLAIHLYRSNATRHKSYPAFDAVVAGIEEEFTDYLSTLPELPEAYREARMLTGFILWSHTMRVDDMDIIYMNKGIHRCTSSWQQCYHAMGQYKNPAYALELMLTVFHYQDEFGMLPDILTDSDQSFGGTKPPFYGVALEFLRHFTDFSFADRRDLTRLYDGLSRWVFWWMNYRDTDSDGIVQYDTADESGWDDSSFFHLGGPTATPDLAAYLILAMDQLALLAEQLDKPYECREWSRRAQQMLRDMQDFFWNGKRFCPRVSGSHEWVECGSVMAFIPLLLGHRLPEEILDRMEEDLTAPGKWLTPYGLAGEALDSPLYHDTGWSAGPILGPAQLLVCLGLWFSGKKEVYRKIVTSYADALVAEGFPMVVNPKTGKDVSEGRWGERYPNRMAWTAVVFVILTSLLEA